MVVGAPGAGAQGTLASCCDVGASCVSEALNCPARRAPRFLVFRAARERCGARPGAPAPRRGSSGSARLCVTLGGAGTHSGERLACVHGLWRRARCFAGVERSWAGLRGVGAAGAGLDAPWPFAQRDHELCG